MPEGAFLICITAGPAWEFWTIPEVVGCCRNREQNNSNSSKIENQIKFPPFISYLPLFLIEVRPDEPSFVINLDF